jgi:hypothetical protein
VRGVVQQPIAVVQVLKSPLFIRLFGVAMSAVPTQIHRSRQSFEQHYLVNIPGFCVFMAKFFVDALTASIQAHLRAI